MLEVKTNDDKKIANFNQSLTKFKKNFTKEIQWHQAVIKKKDPKMDV